MFRTYIPSKSATQETQSYLVSVSDLMAGLLFIFIIALTVFALNLREAEDRTMKSKAELERITHFLTMNRKARAELLETIKQEMEIHGLKIEIDPDQGVLRLRDNVLFDKASADLKPKGKEVLNALSYVFHKILPAYLCTDTEEEARSGDGLERFGTVETIFVEGHTDMAPIWGGKYRDNWELSVYRAMNTYRYLTGLTDSSLERLKNCDDEYLFSVSGYAFHRPVASDHIRFGQPLNRRIDFRFVMTPPKSSPEVVRAIEKATKHLDRP